MLPYINSIKGSIKLLMSVLIFTAISVVTNAGSLKDTGFKDLSGKYAITMPAIRFPDNVINLRVAVISTSLLGKTRIAWSETKTSYTKETEKEFEIEMLRCADGKDKTNESGAVTVKKPLYCERVGYSEGAAGSRYDLHYCSFSKDKLLIIIEFTARWQNCAMSEDAEGAKKCEANKIKQTKSMATMVEKMVKMMKIAKGK